MGRPFIGPGFRQGKVGMNISQAVVVALSFAMVSGSFVSLAGSGGSTTQTPVKHIVVLMMENHSFDNLFGTYGSSANGSTVPGVTIPEGLLSGNHSSQLRPVPRDLQSTADPYEGYSNYHRDWNYGMMNGFANGSGLVSMEYFTSVQAGPEWALAQQYSLGDMYFSETLSESLPNRLFSLSGFSPVKSDQFFGPPFVLYNQTIFGEMDHYGISWSYYFKNPGKGIYPLDFIKNIGNHHQNLKNWTDFVDSVKSGSLPSVSWVSPISGGVKGYSQHPAENMVAGEMWILYIVHLIMQSSLWKSTAIIVTYDEGGGYYDQVAPPVMGGKRLGFRVPFILISPYAKEDYVSNTVMTHTSILGFIDYNWNMPALNSLVLDSNLPLDMFNFAVKYKDGNIARPPLSLNTSQLAFIPQTLSGSLSHATKYSNVSSFFPVKAQYSVSTLPYSTRGSSSFNLSGQSGTVYVSHDITYVPANSVSQYAVLTAAAVSAAAASITAVLVIRRRRR